MIFFVKKKNMKNIFYFLGITFFIQSCAPGISQYQNAEILGPGNSAHTLSLELDNDDASFGTAPGDPLDVNLSYRYQIGVTEKSDFGFGAGLTLQGFIGIGINSKYQLIQDKLSLNIPIVLKGVGGTRIETNPTLLYTYNPDKNIKNTICIQYIAFYDNLEEENNNFMVTAPTSAIYLAHNWVIKSNYVNLFPELGLVIQNDGYSSFYNLKIGLGATINRKRKESRK